MRISKEQRNYKPLVPSNYKPFDEMSEAEAKTYFNWFVSQVDERAEYIRHKAAIYLDIDINMIDFSLESLKHIWKWFLCIAEIDKTPMRKLRQIRMELASTYPKESINDMLSEFRYDLNTFTRMVILDVGMYVGKTFVSNYPQLKWGYRRDRPSFINQPQIIGFIDDAYNPPFKPDFVPNHIVDMVAGNLFDNTQNENDLYDICIKWVRLIP